MPLPPRKSKYRDMEEPGPEEGKRKPAKRRRQSSSTEESERAPSFRRPAAPQPISARAARDLRQAEESLRAKAVAEALEIEEASFQQTNDGPGVKEPAPTLKVLDYVGKESGQESLATPSAEIQENHKIQPQSPERSATLKVLDYVAPPPRKQKPREQPPPSENLKVLDYVPKIDKKSSKNATKSPRSASKTQTAKDALSLIQPKAKDSPSPAKKARETIKTPEIPEETPSLASMLKSTKKPATSPGKTATQRSPVVDSSSQLGPATGQPYGRISLGVPAAKRSTSPEASTAPSSPSPDEEPPKERTKPASLKKKTETKNSPKAKGKSRYYQKSDDEDSYTNPRSGVRPPPSSKSEKVQPKATPAQDAETSSEEDAIIISHSVLRVQARAPPSIVSTPAAATPEQAPQVEDSDSRFVPVLGQNIFNLVWSEEVLGTDAMQLDSSPSPRIVRRGYLLGLKAKEALVIAGVCEMVVLRGQVAINGATLTNASNPLPIFAPVTSPLPMVTAISSNLELQGQEKSLNLKDHPLLCRAQSEPETSTAFYQDFDAIIALMTYQTGIEGIERLSRMGGITAKSKRMWAAPMQMDEAASEHWHCPIDGHGETPATSFDIVGQQDARTSTLKIPASWSKAFDTICSQTQSQSAPITYVEGQKGTGKSTFGKMSLNSLLNVYERVAYIDLDFGQSEFTPPGMTSLHIFEQPFVGPNYTQHRQPQRAHYLGETSASHDKDFALAALEDLMAAYREIAREGKDSAASGNPRKSTSIPLIVNTDSWIKAASAEYRQSCVTLVQPSHRFLLGSQENPSYEPNPSINVLESVTARTIQINQADNRDLSLLAYFNTVKSENSNRKTWNFATPLLEQPSLMIEWTSPLITSIVLVPNNGIEYKYVMMVLNRSIIAFVDRPDSRQVTNKNLPYDETVTRSPDPRLGSCIGLGYCRGCDIPNRRFEIVTPLSPVQLNRPTFWVRAMLAMPAATLIDGYTDVNEVPYFRPAGQGEGRRHIRRNVARKAHAN